MQKQLLEEYVLDGFNRTFMELKLGNIQSGNAEGLSFNRTFMELK